MKCHDLFSVKNRTKLRMLSATKFTCTLRVSFSHKLPHLFSVKNKTKIKMSSAIKFALRFKIIFSF